MLASGGKHLTCSGTSGCLDPAVKEAGTRTESQGQETAVGVRKDRGKGRFGQDSELVGVKKDNPYIQK